MPPQPGESAISSFERKKEKILSSLAVPLSSYKDRSPKGSVDEGIRDLIDEINAIDGLVTTSSCAGRISVFLEGEKTSPSAQDHNGEREAAEELHEEHNQDAPTTEGTDLNGPSAKPKSMSKNAPGGKGNGGRWLFVSHSPLNLPLSSPSSTTPLHSLFSLHPAHSTPRPLPSSPRFIRLQFEPLLLHILCATLSHASAPLSAAISSGFRESGLQSLSCLSHPDTHHPMLGIRSAGLSFSTVIGYLDENGVQNSLVSEEYLENMIPEISRRFRENDVRRERFRSALRKALATKTVPMIAVGDGNGQTNGKWTKKGAQELEDPVLRAQRKREEGLRRREELSSRTHLSQTDPAGRDEENPPLHLLDGLQE